MSKIEYFKYTDNNKNALELSTECACIYCSKKFTSEEIYEWTDNGTTAICPYCSVDSIVPNALIFYTEADLKLWYQQGFSQCHSIDTLLLNDI